MSLQFFVPQCMNCFLLFMISALKCLCRWSQLTICCSSSAGGPIILSSSSFYDSSGIVRLRSKLSTFPYEHGWCFGRFHRLNATASSYWGGIWEDSGNITVSGVGGQSGHEPGRRIFTIYGHHGAIFGTIVVGCTTGICFGDRFGLKLELKVISSAAFFCRRLYEPTWAGLES